MRARLCFATRRRHWRHTAVRLPDARQGSRTIIQWSQPLSIAEGALLVHLQSSPDGRATRHNFAGPTPSCPSEGRRRPASIDAAQRKRGDQ